MSIEIKEKCDRGKLSEGRNQGIGFALLEKVGTKEYHTVNPISPCKDYLAEVVFTENTGHPTSGCGLVYPKKRDILAKKTSYLVFKNQKTKQGGFTVEKMSFEDFTEDLRGKIKNIENFLNKYQENLEGFKPLKIEPANDDQYLVKFDSRWANSTYSISLLTLLLRIGKHYNGEDVEEFLNKLPNTSIDYSLVKTAFKKVMTIQKEKKLPGIPQSQITSIEKNKNWSPHHLGICSWNEKYE